MSIPLSLNGELPDLLRRFDCTRGLSDDDLIVLGARCRLDRVPAGERLFAAGDHDSAVLLLVDGTLELVAGDGSLERLEAGTAAAGQPVSNRRPRACSAQATTPATLLRFDGDDLADWLASLPAAAGGAVAGFGTPFDDFAALALDFGAPGPLSAHRVRLTSGELSLPSLPTVAIETCRAIDRDDADAAAVARVLLNDPAITAKLLRAANGPLFYGRTAVDTCERAVMRLGLDATRRLVIAFAVRDVFRTRDPAVSRMAERLWSHSTSVAALSFVLARRLGGFDPEEAQLAGLLHDIGVVPVLGYAAGEPTLAACPRDIESLAASLRVTLGRQLLESWGLSGSLVAVVEHAEDWWRSGGGAADLADLVTVAQCISLADDGDDLARPGLDRLPAFARLTGGRTRAAEMLALAAEAEEQVAEVRALLQG